MNPSTGPGCSHSGCTSAATHRSNLGTKPAFCVDHVLTIHAEFVQRRRCFGALMPPLRCQDIARFRFEWVGHLGPVMKDFCARCALRLTAELDEKKIAFACNRISLSSWNP